ncbi:MAG: DHH family phosphoesterase, partial [Longimicrobiales bacterium]
TDVLATSATRLPALTAIAQALRACDHALLTTHVNADGDGVGCEAAVATWLAGVGKRVSIVNPTPFPDSYRYLIERPDQIADPGTPAATEAMAAADLVVVLDTGEPRRVGRVAGALARKTVVVLDHHLPSDQGFGGLVLQDPSASATGELVFDLLVVAELKRPWPRPVVEGVYTAIVTDTGSFRFSNTTPRAHALAGDLIAQGVDPEAMYRRIFATVPLRRIELLRHALARLEVDAQLPLTWITIERGVMERLDTGTDDLEGVVEHARSIEGTEVALLFRETADGSTKVSFRSAGDVDVNAIARRFGGGGHIKASGALLNEPLERGRARVLDATREALRDAGLGSRVPTNRE